MLSVLAGVMFFDQPVQVVEGEAEYVFFYLPSCPHCHEQMEFHSTLEQEFPDVQITSYDVSTPSGRNAYQLYVGGDVRTPVTVIGNSTIVGFDSAQTTGEQIREALRGEVVVSEEDQTVLGRDPSSFSLPLLAVVLGFLDGFNPCAMWMLVYLLSLVATVKSKPRRWLIVGVFLAASAVMYFLFMSAWLNAFLVVGFLRPVQILISVFAIGFGVWQLREYFSGDPITCKVDASRSKKYERAKSIVHRPLGIAMIAGLIALAFAVNSVEFLCSAGIPVIFTSALALAEISSAYQYLLIGVYVLMYMIDDLVIFLLAMFAIDRFISDAYMRYAKVITGVLLLLLGILMGFFPGVLF